MGWKGFKIIFHDKDDNRPDHRRNPFNVQNISCYYFVLLKSEFFCTIALCHSVMLSRYVQKIN